ncbi:zf-HC2 domain-containing protein [candidate division KSB1 bacterium]|nr:zf-HC2 domain-containing protein [candidate division KSB1 bacterium]
MNHLTLSELILYVNKRGISDAERLSFEEHFLQCPQCSLLHEKILRESNKMLESNKTECHFFLKNIDEYLDHNLNAEKKSKMDQHLEGCERCKSLYQWITEIPSRDAIEAENIYIPLQSRKNIESTVINAFQRKEKFKSKISTYIHEIELMLQPIRPEFAIRGNSDEELKVIEHAGGTLRIHTGLKNTDVELTNIFEEFTLKAKTNEHGIVIFNDVREGDYVISVKEYQIIELKEKK